MDSPSLQRFLDLIVLIGAALSAILLGVRRMYRTARYTEELLDNSRQSVVDRADMKAELASFRIAQNERDVQRDKEIASLKGDMKIIVREVTPNGGSSIKDVVNKLRIDIAVLNEWKREHS